MLQQTQVAAVIPFYHEWMRRFPDFAALARASEHEVLHAWQGLGYYARARNLRAAAIAVVNRHGGELPRAVEAIRDLPGIGRYTANALATFAFDQAVPIVEANIARVLTRLFDIQMPIDNALGRKALWSHATQLLPSRDAGRYNSGLMELGALVCGAHPKCQLCPVKTFCRATEPALLPRKKPRPELRQLTEHHGFVLRRRRILLEQSQDRWRGMWILPRLSTAPPESRLLHRSQFPFTHHRITLAVHPSENRHDKPTAFQRWFPLSAIAALPLPSPHRRALNDLLATARSSIS